MSTVKLTKQLSKLLLGIWLVMTELIGLLGLSFAGMGTLMAVLAIAAGALTALGQ